MSLLTIDNITVNYGRLTALRHASLKLAKGETFFVTGPNGAGKSTLLNHLFNTNLRYNTAGTIQQFQCGN